MMELSLEVPASPGDRKGVFMDLGLKGKIVVITGGAQGIGKAAALEFAKEGAVCAVCARREERLKEAQEEFAAKGYELFAMKADVTKHEELQAFADAVAAKYGRIDVWINNAGANHFQKLIDYTVEEFRAMLDINLVSMFDGSCIAARHMKETGGGVILNASAYSAYTPIAGKGPYAACKNGMLSLVKVMAAEFAPYHIRVNAYAPGPIHTEINQANIDKFGEEKLASDIPMKRIGEPEELAQAICFLASDSAAGFINGVCLEISGGKRCVQNPMFGYENP